MCEIIEIYSAGTARPEPTDQQLTSTTEQHRYIVCVDIYAAVPVSAASLDDARGEVEEMPVNQLIEHADGMNVTSVTDSETGQTTCF